MILSSSRIAPDVRSRHEEWFAAYDLEKGFSDLESRRGRATRITRVTCRERRVVNLLLEGCDNVAIAKQLRIAHRTVKACFNHLYLRFGITCGIKRVKLATLVYRNRLSSDAILMEGNKELDGNSPSPLPPQRRAVEKRESCLSDRRKIVLVEFGKEFGPSEPRKIRLCP